MKKEQVESVEVRAVSGGGGSGGAAMGGPGGTADDGRLPGGPSPAEVRAALVQAVAEAGESGLSDREAEQAVAARFTALNDPLDADIEGLMLLGVLERDDFDRLHVTTVAEHYLVGARVSIR